MAECPELGELTIIDAEGTRAYFIASTSSTKIAVLYHGNAERACDSAYLVPTLTALQYDVLLVEYAGYAGDPGQRPSVERLLYDVERVDRWIAAKDYKEVAIIGRSIGTGFAAYHASLRSPDRLLLISPFDSLSNLAQEHYTLYPTSLLLKRDLDNITNASKAKRVLIIHGRNDKVIPVERGRALYDELPTDTKTFIEVPLAAHDDVLGSPDAWSAVREFLQ